MNRKNPAQLLTYLRLGGLQYCENGWLAW